MILEKFKLKGKVALVSGGGRGIGRAIALALAEAGATVVCAARTETEIEAVAEEARKLSGQALAVRCDVNEEQQLDHLVEQTKSAFGGLDILVNNAGGSLPTLALYTTRQALEDAFHFNVTSAFLLSQKSIPVMLERDGGVILNISSALSRVVESGFVSYGTAKAALSHMTRLLADEFAPKIRVNALAVGSVETDALALVLSTPQLKQQMIEMTPMARLGQTEDVAAAALYLCSPAASWVTGKILEVDGGTVASNWPMKFNALENLPE